MPHEQSHAALDKNLPGALIGSQRPGKIVETDEANGHVVERDSQTFGVSDREEHFIGPLITSEAFLEAVLPVKEIAEVNLDVGEVALVVQAPEDYFRALRCSQGPIVVADKNAGLNRSVESAGFLLLVTDFSEDR